MLKFIMRKTFYKSADRETQNKLFQLVYAQNIIHFICYTFWIFILLLSLIQGIIISLLEWEKIALSTKIITYAYTVFFGTGWILIIRIFREAMIAFSNLMAQKIYFKMYTIKGNALHKEDFEIIENSNPELYEYISNQCCIGYCYATCFDILKIIKKGYIEFVAIKEFYFDFDKREKKDFTMHVIYVNDDWAFDPYSSRQYPVDKLHNIYAPTKIWRTFNFDDIKDIDYETFKKEIAQPLAEWCHNNNCLQLLAEN